MGRTHRDDVSGPVWVLFSGLITGKPAPADECAAVVEGAELAKVVSLVLEGGGPDFECFNFCGGIRLEAGAEGRRRRGGLPGGLSAVFVLQMHNGFWLGE